MGRRQRATEVLDNLPQLQNLIKRDPASYREEFLQQWRHFESSLSIFDLKPEDEYKDFSELLMFLSHVSMLYPKDCEGYPDKLLNLLQRHYMVLNPSFRKSIVQSIILMRNKRQVSSIRVLPVFFTMFRCQDKALRELLYAYILNDIKSANKGQHKNNQLNKVIQNYMFSIINSPEAQNKTSPGAIAAKKSLDVCIELYKKNIWNDAKTVNVIALGAFSPITKIKVTCVQFFLNPTSKKSSDDGDSDTDDSSDSDSQSNSKKMSRSDLLKLKKNHAFTKKTKSKQRLIEKATKLYKKTTKENEKEEDIDELEEKKKNKDQPHFRVLSLIHDPQNFAEKLFSLSTSNSNSSKKGGQTVERFEVRLMQLKLVSRLMGYHQLYIPSFYPFMLRYLQPHQRDVTTILALYASAIHQYTPPDAIQPQLRAIANNFVSDHCSPEVISAGLNSIRAVASRQPLSVDSELLSDLIEYRKHRDKGVMMAARSLLQLYREKYPEILPRKERGKTASEKLISDSKDPKPLFGKEYIAEGVDGIDLLDLPTSESEDGGDIESENDSEDEDDNHTIPDQKDITKNGENELSGSDYESLDEEELELLEENLEEIDENDLDLDSENDDDQDVEFDSHEAADSSNKAEDSELSADKVLNSGAAGKKKQRVDMIRILTDEDFAKIDRIKQRRLEKEQLAAEENNTNVSGNKKRKISSTSTTENNDEEKDYYNTNDILGAYHAGKKAKATYEERIKSIQAGREGREKYASKKSKRESDGRSTSNKEKRKTKNFKMISHKQGNVVKGKRSLVEKRRELRSHIKKQKKKGF
ncbi:Protein SDA1-like protein [Smittium culicis]|uniref:Protein SDA1 n=1 Tax=Smittium culicis TaxID=133412 RepID=A0A1R1YJC8_9FUNG|nr:Protein SDA1-like protein [Smittium culicis]